MASPIGPPSSPPIIPGSTDSDSSPLKRRAEVHNRQRSNQSCPDANTSDRLQRASLLYQVRRSTPLLLQDEIAVPYKPQYIKPLTVRETAPISRKPVQETPRKGDLPKARNPNVTPESTKVSAGYTTDWLSPKLLTLVSEEDNLRRSYTWSKLPRRNHSFPQQAKPQLLPILDLVVEDQEQLPSPPKSQSSRQKSRDSSGLSLFNLEPLRVTKTSSTQFSDTVVTSGNSDDKRELNSQPPKTPQLHSSYNPALFSTLHGVGPNKLVATKRKPSKLQIQLTASINSPSPIKVTGKSVHFPSPKATPKPTTTKFTHSHSPKPNTHTQAVISPSTKSFIPISSKYINALKTTASANQETRQAQRLRRHASLARLRELTPSPSLYTSSTGTATPPLKLWISDLCNASMPLPTPSPATTKPESRTRTEPRDRFHHSLPDDAYAAAAAAADEEAGLGGRKAAKSTPAEELTVMIDDMLNDLTGKFHAITSEIMAKMDDMGRRIDNLEASLNHEAEKADGDKEEEGRAGRS